MDLWLSQNFIVPQKTPVKSDGQNFWKIAIKSLRDLSLTCIIFENEMMCIYSANINLTADIVQSLALYLNLEQIDVSTIVTIVTIFNMLLLLGFLLLIL